MIKRLIILVICFIVCFVNTACSNNEISTSVGKGEYKITNIKIFKDTPAWELVLAVQDQKVDEIEKIAKDKPELLNYQDPNYGVTPLIWSIGMEKYESTERLLKCGSDANIATVPYGKTPLLLASGYSWVDNEAKKDPKYVELLLYYGADPNISYIGYMGAESQSTIEPGATPLMYSIGAGIEKTRALVESGADINQKSQSQSTAAIYALFYDQDPQYAHYLIVEKKAIVIEPYFSRIILSGDDPSKEFFPVNLLRDWFFELDSKEYRIKMEIVKEFERQGIDYWSTQVPERMIKKIKKLYPDTWEEVITKY